MRRSSFEIPHPVSVLVLLCALLVALGCGQPPADDEVDTNSPCYSPLDLSNPTLPVPPVAADNTQSAWDCFSWNSFAALNWPADTRRGFPDLSPGVDFKSASNTDQGVWETFKEKRELFRADGMPSTVWNSPENFPTDQIALQNGNNGFCPDVSAEEQAHAAKISRHLLSVSKLSQTLDETAEVSSEALESQDQLCAGYTDDPATACASSNPPQCCTVHGQKVGPRVWKGQAASSTQPVYYEVRVNWDFWNYVINFDYYLDEVAFTDAILGQISLPYRTAATKRPGNSQNVDAVINYSTDACMVNYESDFQVPCGIGAVQIKSAWIQLPDPYDPSTDPASDDPSLYHTTEAIYYEPSASEEGKLCMQPGTFGLIGLHIIQRVHVDSTGPEQGIGGAFIFSTWEHNNLVNDDPSAPPNYTYANYLANNDLPLTNPDPFPTLDNALAVVPHQEAGTNSRLLPETVTVNQAAQEQLSQANSVWQNYQLIGTQFSPYASASDSQSAGQPHFLANLVIETNIGLQQFMGLPPQNPGLLPPQYTDGGDPPKRFVDPNTTLLYERGAHNMTWGGTAYNQGGCMGCHGVAQQNGYSFSFVLLGGQRGADIDTETSFEIPAPPLPSQSLPLNIGAPPLVGGSVDPSAPTELLAAAGTKSGDAVDTATASPQDPLQLWVLVAPIPGTSGDLQGTYQVTLDSGVMLVDQPGAAKVGTSSGIGGEQNFWRLVPYEEDFNPLGSRGYTLHLYNFMLQGTQTGMVLTRASSGDGVSVEAATTKEADPELFNRQLWQIVRAPGESDG